VDTKLYVGNLSPVTTAEDLRMMFSTMGGVLSVELIKDKKTGKPKGFAFVEMVSQGDAGKAVSQFNGAHLDQRKIKVMVARANTSQTRRSAGYVEYKSYRDSIIKSS
jgi:RNA recognition motif-containing protein